MIRNKKWILNKHGDPVLCNDLLTWARWMEHGDEARIVKQEGVGQMTVSTVFLGLDHNFGDGPPILWETMIFGPGPLSHKQWRCAGGREQAEAMHARAVKEVEEFYEHPRG